MSRARLLGPVEAPGRGAWSFSRDDEAPVSSSPLVSPPRTLFFLTLRLLFVFLLCRSHEFPKSEDWVLFIYVSLMLSTEPGTYGYSVSDC